MESKSYHHNIVKFIEENQVAPLNVINVVSLDGYPINGLIIKEKSESRLVIFAENSHGYYVTEYLPKQCNVKDYLKSEYSLQDVFNDNNW